MDLDNALLYYLSGEIRTADLIHPIVYRFPPPACTSLPWKNLHQHHVLLMYKILLQLSPVSQTCNFHCRNSMHLVHHCPGRHNNQCVFANIVRRAEFTDLFWVSRLNKTVPNIVGPGFPGISVERKFIQFVQDPFRFFSSCQMWTNIISSPVYVPLRKVLSCSQIYAIYTWYKIP